MTLDEALAATLAACVAFDPEARPVVAEVVKALRASARRLDVTST